MKISTPNVNIIFSMLKSVRIWKINYILVFALQIHLRGLIDTIMQIYL